jgi:hypothetical protein
MMPRTAAAHAIIGLVLSTTCVYDPDALCSPGQELDDRGYCLVPVPGAACDAAKPCVGTHFPHCLTPAAAPGTAGGAAVAAGYCTRTGCVTSKDCPSGYACDLSSMPSVCRRPPVGQGKTCHSQGECAGGEATYCDTKYLMQCLVEGCATSPSNCSEGWTCCDLSAKGLAKTLCIPLPQCPP